MICLWAYLFFLLLDWVFCWNPFLIFFIAIIVFFSSKICFITLMISVSLLNFSFFLMLFSCLPVFSWVSLRQLYWIIFQAVHKSPFFLESPFLYYLVPWIMLCLSDYWWFLLPCIDVCVFEEIVTFSSCYRLGSVRKGRQVCFQSPWTSRPATLVCGWESLVPGSRGTSLSSVSTQAGWCLGPRVWVWSFCPGTNLKSGSTRVGLDPRFMGANLALQWAWTLSPQTGVSLKPGFMGLVFF